MYIQAMIAFAIALAVVLISGPLLIPYLTRLKVGQVIRDDGPERHLSKAGTPTMGGLMLIPGICAGVLAISGSNQYALAVMAVMLLHAAIGFRDDYLKVVLKRSLGLKARHKLLLQLAIGLMFTVFLAWFSDRGTALLIPFTGQWLELSYWYYLLVILVILATSNTVNLTDGLDGLVSGVTIMVALAYGVIAWQWPNEPAYGLAAFSLAIAGGCLGFLYYNRFPARVFMGDTGSMALGGAVAAIAILTRTELFLLIIGGVYVLEGLSDIIQVAYFKKTGRRVFKMAPLHHHFELMGWKETRVVKVFWMLSAGLAGSGLLAYYLTFWK